jgi:hypothetical protein
MGSTPCRVPLSHAKHRPDRSGGADRDVPPAGSARSAVGPGHLAGSGRHRDADAGAIGGRHVAARFAGRRTARLRTSGGRRGLRTRRCRRCLSRLRYGRPRRGRRCLSRLRCGRPRRGRPRRGRLRCSRLHRGRTARRPRRLPSPAPPAPCGTAGRVRHRVVVVHPTRMPDGGGRRAAAAASERAEDRGRRRTAIARPGRPPVSVRRVRRVRRRALRGSGRPPRVRVVDGPSWSRPVARCAARDRRTEGGSDRGRYASRRCATGEG